MKKKILKFIDEQEYIKALEEISKYIENMPFDAEIASFAAISFLNIGHYGNALDYILKGIECSPNNYELYMLLGNCFPDENPALAYLCYEHSLELSEIQCGKAAEDTVFLADLLNNLTTENDVSVKPVSAIVYCKNSQSTIADCLNSIQDTCQNSINEIIIYDNASTDKTREYITNYSPNVKTKIIFGDEPSSFAKAINKCIDSAEPQNDIFIISADSIITKNALFTLRMGLYSSRNTVISGCCSNTSHTGQNSDINLETKEEFLVYSETKNRPLKNSLENRFWLSCFGALIKRRFLSECGLFDKILDGKFSAECDLGIRAINAGYSCVLCRNSYIYTTGNIDALEYKNFSYSDQTSHDNKHLIEKYGFLPIYYSNPNENITEAISRNTQDRYAKIRVLEVGCGMGATLMNIKYIYPNSSVCGIEIIDEVAKLGSKQLDIIQGNIENMELPYQENEFDYIIFGDVLEHLRQPEKVLTKMRNYLKPQGIIVTSIPNLMNAAVIYDLLVNGNFTYRSAGILDSTHLRFFTYGEILRMFERCNYSVLNVTMTKVASQSTDAAPYKAFFEKLTAIEDVVEKIQFDAFQYLVVARKNQ